MRTRVRTNEDPSGDWNDAPPSRVPHRRRPSPARTSLLAAARPPVASFGPLLARPSSSERRRRCRAKPRRVAAARHRRRRRRRCSSFQSSRRRLTSILTCRRRHGAQPPDRRRRRWASSLARPSSSSPDIVRRRRTSLSSSSSTNKLVTVSCKSHGQNLPASKGCYRLSCEGRSIVSVCSAGPCVAKLCVNRASKSESFVFCSQAQLHVSSLARDPMLRPYASRLLELVCVCISMKLRSYSSGTRIQEIWW